ncbi:MAG: 4Fe-4S dicluster domain-containing protein [Desulfobacterales bacterium]
MEWTAEAEEALKRVPFFVRRRVRARVEEETAAEGKQRVTLAEVRSAQARYLSGQAAEIKGWQLETCFGPGGCPQRALATERLVGRLERVLQAARLYDFLRREVKGGLKFHHEFRVAVADCPNACSQPQIRDVGIIGACVPEATAEPCSQCGACREACPEQAIRLAAEVGRPPATDLARCLHCGLCIRRCPTGTLAEGWSGYRVLLGGRLGRHPRLAFELPGIFEEDRVVEILQECLELYKRRSRGGERFARIFDEADFAAWARRFCGENAAEGADRRKG